MENPGSSPVIPPLLSATGTKSDNNSLKCLRPVKKQTEFYQCSTNGPVKPLFAAALPYLNTFPGKRFAENQVFGATPICAV